LKVNQPKVECFVSSRFPPKILYFDGAVHLLRNAFRGEREGFEKMRQFVTGRVQEFVTFSINELFFEIFDKM